ncbi:NDP-sugar synthase [Candidatus Hecatella orcuttiae]|jgi:NDP-sugar pyrophosphorylase family protein|uniref:NDP-sugar synthase n=1 Tax=Candidatus Hecatella orcuttiae TaxID=1935119 RepID=UPI002867B119|nr:NDP-sugar synthase [Candidatus Hecatella orcuttiae]
MKAIILAGGPGTRLRPLSCTRPKLLFPILNRPALDWTLENLSKAGVSEVVLAVNYMAAALQAFLGRRKYGLRILYSKEPRALGTGGPIKLAEKILKLKPGEPLLILNGDIWSDVDFAALREAHRRHMEEYDAVMTLTLREVKDVSRYGVVEVDGKGRILKFREKPRGGKRKGLINAGIYLTDRKIFRRLEERRFSLERELFPRLAEEGKLYGFKHEGLWSDIGKIEDFMAVNFKVLELRAEGRLEIGRGAKVAREAQLRPPVWVGEKAKIAAGAVVGPYAVLGNGVHVGERCKIKKAVVFDRAEVGARSLIQDSVVGEGAVIGRGVKIRDQTVIGDHAFVADALKLVRKVSICPHKEVGISLIGPRILA